MIKIYCNGIVINFWHAIATRRFVCDHKVIISISVIERHVAGVGFNLCYNRINPCIHPMISCIIDSHSSRMYNHHGKPVDVSNDEEDKQSIDVSNDDEDADHHYLFLW
eukprot:313268_1